MARAIVLPNSVRTFQCQVPDCGEHFYARGAYEQHVARCARKHRESILAMSEQHAAAVDDDPFQKVHDPEALDWVKKQIRDGRPGYGP